MVQLKQVLRVVRLYATLLAAFAVFLLIECMCVAWALAGTALTALAFHAALHDLHVLPLAIVSLISVLYCAFGAVRTVPWLRRLVHLYFVSPRLLEPRQFR